LLGSETRGRDTTDITSRAASRAVGTNPFTNALGTGHGLLAAQSERVRLPIGWL